MVRMKTDLGEEKRVVHLIFICNEWKRKASAFEAQEGHPAQKLATLLVPKLILKSCR